MIMSIETVHKAIAEALIVSSNASFFIVEPLTILPKGKGL
jgi:hypothetical protein